MRNPKDQRPYLKPRTKHDMREPRALVSISVHIYLFGRKMTNMPLLHVFVFELKWEEIIECNCFYCSRFLFFPTQCCPIAKT